MLANWYFWQERLQRMVLEGESEWFDDTRTPDRVEQMAGVFHEAALAAKERWAPEMGENPAEWRWGDVHTLALVSPIRREGAGKALLGTGPMSMHGSGETLCRGWYDYKAPFAVTHCASLRMVVDMGDGEKIAAVLPGGVTGRVFSPHQKDQVEAYMGGGKLYWWFSDAAIREHARHRLRLAP
jgi:penicillin amidase